MVDDLRALSGLAEKNLSTGDLKLMEEDVTHEGDVTKQGTDESDIFSDDSETWISDLDVLPPELHFMIAEHVGSNGTASACMLTQVKKPGTRINQNLLCTLSHKGESLLAFVDGGRLSLGKGV